MKLGIFASLRALFLKFTMYGVTKKLTKPYGRENYVKRRNYNKFCFLILRVGMVNSVARRYLGGTVKKLETV